MHVGSKTFRKNDFMKMISWIKASEEEERKLVEVTEDNASAADHMFSILMGEKVEPRRKFIEENATYVTEIDT